jgi:hypothetical protein
MSMTAQTQTIQPTLFETDRPRRNSPAVKEAALADFMPRVLKWMRQGGDNVRDDELPEIQEQLLEALDFGNDGYQAASQLDRWHSWSCDSELVEILDGWPSCLYSAEDKAVRRWVKENKPQPPYPLGAHVEFGDAIESPNYGEIVRIDAERATYTIRRPGDAAPGQLGTQGVIIAFERVRPHA